MDPDHQVARDIGNISVLPVEMFNDKDFVQFPDVGVQRWETHVCDLYLLWDQP